MIKPYAWVGKQCAVTCRDPNTPVDPPKFEKDGLLTRKQIEGLVPLYKFEDVVRLCIEEIENSMPVTQDMMSTDICERLDRICEKLNNLKSPY